MPLLWLCNRSRCLSSKPKLVEPKCRQPLPTSVFTCKHLSSSSSSSLSSTFREHLIDNQNQRRYLAYVLRNSSNCEYYRDKVLRYSPLLFALIHDECIEDAHYTDNKLSALAIVSSSSCNDESELQSELEKWQSTLQPLHVYVMARIVEANQIHNELLKSSNTWNAKEISEISNGCIDYPFHLRRWHVALHTILNCKCEIENTLSDAIALGAESAYVWQCAQQWHIQRAQMECLCNWPSIFYSIDMEKVKYARDNINGCNVNVNIANRQWAAEIWLAAFLLSMQAKRTAVCYNKTLCYYDQQQEERMTLSVEDIAKEMKNEMQKLEFMLSCIVELPSEHVMMGILTSHTHPTLIRKLLHFFIKLYLCNQVHSAAHVHYCNDNAINENNNVNSHTERIKESVLPTGNDHSKQNAVFFNTIMTAILHNNCIFDKEMFSEMHQCIVESVLPFVGVVVTKPESTKEVWEKNERMPFWTKESHYLQFLQKEEQYEEYCYELEGQQKQERDAMHKAEIKMNANNFGHNLQVSNLETKAQLIKLGFNIHAVKWVPLVKRWIRVYTVMTKGLDLYKGFTFLLHLLPQVVTKLQVTVYVRVIGALLDEGRCCPLCQLALREIKCSPKQKPKLEEVQSLTHIMNNMFDENTHVNESKSDNNCENCYNGNTYKGNKCKETKSDSTDIILKEYIIKEVQIWGAIVDLASKAIKCYHSDRRAISQIWTIVFKAAMTLTRKQCEMHEEEGIQESINSFCKSNSNNVVHKKSVNDYDNLNGTNNGSWNCAKFKSYGVCVSTLRVLQVYKLFSSLHAPVEINYESISQLTRMCVESLHHATLQEANELVVCFIDFVENVRIVRVYHSRNNTITHSHIGQAVGLITESLWNHYGETALHLAELLCVTLMKWRNECDVTCNMHNQRTRNAKNKSKLVSLLVSAMNLFRLNAHACLRCPLCQRECNVTLNFPTYEELYELSTESVCLQSNACTKIVRVHCAQCNKELNWEQIRQMLRNIEEKQTNSDRAESLCSTDDYELMKAKAKMNVETNSIPVVSADSEQQWQHQQRQHLEQSVLSIPTHSAPDNKNKHVMTSEQSCELLHVSNCERKEKEALLGWYHVWYCEVCDCWNEDREYSTNVLNKMEREQSNGCINNLDASKISTITLVELINTGTIRLHNNFSVVQDANNEVERINVSCCKHCSSVVRFNDMSDICISGMLPQWSCGCESLNAPNNEHCETCSSQYTNGELYSHDEHKYLTLKNDLDLHEPKDKEWQCYTCTNCSAIVVNCNAHSYIIYFEEEEKENERVINNVDKIYNSNNNGTGNTNLYVCQDNNEEQTNTQSYQLHKLRLHLCPHCHVLHPRDALLFARMHNTNSKSNYELQLYNLHFSINDAMNRMRSCEEKEERYSSEKCEYYEEEEQPSPSLLEQYMCRHCTVCGENVNWNEVNENGEFYHCGVVHECNEYLPFTCQHCKNKKQHLCSNNKEINTKTVMQNKSIDAQNMEKEKSETALAENSFSTERNVNGWNCGYHCPQCRWPRPELCGESSLQYSTQAAESISPVMRESKLESEKEREIQSCVLWQCVQEKLDTHITCGEWNYGWERECTHCYATRIHSDYECKIAVPSSGWQCKECNLWNPPWQLLTCANCAYGVQDVPTCLLCGLQHLSYSCDSMV